MSISGETWLIAGAVTAGWVLLIAIMCALMIGRAWRRADDTKRDELRSNWQLHRNGLLVSVPVALAGSSVAVFAFTLLIASLAPQLNHNVSGHTADVVKGIAAILMTLGVVMIGVAYVMKWQADRGYLLGNVTYPMGKDALDPELNHKALERDLTVGRRQATRLWSLWPVFLAIAILGLFTVIVVSTI